ncbi:MAG TPA: TIGR03016 family PEP-CTERM system-associated outer membrane protein [Gammaproteobacteria bacterium]|nr:TIGR03016 family PEP-CTERM system-associated outer membrane protein [Gammaproteobacteria bacterium]
MRGAVYNIFAGSRSAETRHARRSGRVVFSDKGRQLVLRSPCCRASLRGVLGHCMLGAALLVSSPVSASWSIEPSLKTGVAVSDNVGLASETGLPVFGKETTDLVSELTPGIWVKSLGRRHSLDLLYRMQNLSYAREKQYDISNHQLEATMNGELLRRHLFFEGEASNYQQPIYAHPGVLTDYFLPGERADISTIRLSPYYRYSFGGTARMMLRYTHVQTRIEKRASDGTTNRFNARLANKRWGRVAWNIGYKNERVEREDEFLFDHEVAAANFRYRLSRRFALLARAGSENHNLGTSTTWTVQYENGSYWAAGAGWRLRRDVQLDALGGEGYSRVRLLWNPSRRTSLKVYWRDQEFGMNPGVSWRGEFSMHFRRTVWLASYNETVIALQQALSDRGLYSFRDPDSGFFLPGEVDPETERLVPVYFDPDTGERTDYPNAGKLIPLVFDDFGLFNETFLRRRGQMVFGWQTGEDALTGLLFYEHRTYLEQGDEATSYGLHGNWKHSLDPATELLGGAQYRFHSYRFVPEDEYAWSLEAGMSWKLEGDNTASCLYRYLNRYSASKKNRYHENRITCYVKFVL